MDNGWAIVGVFILGVSLLFGAVMGLGCIVLDASCSAQASRMGFPYSFGPLQDCMIQVDGQWILIASYKVAKVSK